MLVRPGVDAFLTLQDGDRCIMQALTTLLLVEAKLDALPLRSVDGREVELFLHGGQLLLSRRLTKGVQEALASMAKKLNETLGGGVGSQGVGVADLR